MSLEDMARRKWIEEGKIKKPFDLLLAAGCEPDKAIDYIARIDRASINGKSELLGALKLIKGEITRQRKEIR